MHYSDEAQQAYEDAMVLYRDEAWPEALEAMRRVKQEYSSSRWGWLAELRIADIDFKQERFTEALSGFRAWIRYHASQSEATYAHFMIARCHVAQMPDDWFLTPPSHERDLSSAHDAEGALSRFLRDHGESEHAAEARRILGDVRRILAQHELYVASFYASRERWAAAVSRLRGLLDGYEGSGVEPRALLALGEILMRTGQQPEARGAFRELIDEHPQSNEVAAARRYLAVAGEGPVVAVDRGPSRRGGNPVRATESERRAPSTP
jgi:outer membrane protein assembly factor BamD